jgi:signal transduction histidine kinase
VRDWGRGFGETEMVRGGGPGERVGISVMQERVALLGGTFRVLSRPGGGTLIVARVSFEGSGEDVEDG